MPKEGDLVGEAASSQDHDGAAWPDVGGEPQRGEEFEAIDPVEIAKSKIIREDGVETGFKCKVGLFLDNSLLKFSKISAGVQSNRQKHLNIEGRGVWAQTAGEGSLAIKLELIVVPDREQSKGVELHELDREAETGARIVGEQVVDKDKGNWAAWGSQAEYVVLLRQQMEPGVQEYETQYGKNL